MGLDISYYRKVVRVDDVPEDCDFDYDKQAHLSPNPDFPAQADGMMDGLYEFEEAGSFRAGSYSGYNNWRRWLASQAGYRDDDAFIGAVSPESPFLPLVNFSDCEGLIGAETSKRLATDFAAFADKIQGDDHQMAKYRAWQLAFETASDGGAVDFH